MLNREIYQTDPTTHKLINEGVANVNDLADDPALRVLRYELEHFVCEGEYQETLIHVLDTFLANQGQAQQPGVWISGFYGSGKSHLVKMLRALWVNTQLPDGARARDLAPLPVEVKDQLVGLEAAGRRHGGLHAASGTLGASASGSVRLAILSIVLKSVGLPERPNLARFVLWLRSEGIEEKVRTHLEQAGYTWEIELDNFLVAKGLIAALLAAKPQSFTSPAACTDTLRNLYPHVTDVSSDEMLALMRQALTRDGKFPLTLIALDEMQQFIGEDPERAMDVQESVEACCKGIGSSLIFVGTGQTAITGTPSLKKLEGRFTLRFELSDADVETVVRRTILAKRADAIPAIAAVMQANLGEIARHLAGTSLAHRGDDVDDFTQDYPILPVRRRFWEQTLRVLDRTGTQSQLRNQLIMVHKAVQTNLDQPLGVVVPADYLYFDAAEKLLTARELPRKIYEQTMKWRRGSADEKLLARACGLVFLLNRLSSSNTDVGARATVDMIADLMVENLPEGSSALRSKLPGLLDSCALLMRVGDEFRIQTEESRAWTDEFQAQRGLLSNEAHRIVAERNDRLRTRLGEITKLALVQGSAKVARTVSLVLDNTLPADAQRIIVWVRDGWNSDEKTVRDDALGAGNLSPTIFVFVPKRSADDLRHQIIDYKAALATLDKRGVPTSPEGLEARAAMQTICQSAEARINGLLGDAFSGARVFQGGGSEITGASLAEAVREAAQNALLRLYPQFAIADHPAWETVYARAQRGDPDALKAVGDKGAADQNAVCKAILAAVGAGKKGGDLRAHFQAAPYGWSQDAVDGALQVLLVSGHLRATLESGAPAKPTELERRAIGKATYRIESIVPTIEQKLAVRALLQKAGISADTKDLPVKIPGYVARIDALAQRAGGEAPRPATPATTLIDEIRQSSGNEQLLILYNNREALAAQVEEWQTAAARIDKRLPAWNMLSSLLGYADDAPDATILRTQADAIREQRLLLADPDPVIPLLTALSNSLRDALNCATKAYNKAYAEGLARLAANSDWAQIPADQQDVLLGKYHLAPGDRPAVAVGSPAELLQSLAALPLPAFADRTAAVSGRFDKLLAEAARIVAPAATVVALPRRTLSSDAELESWLAEVDVQLRAALATGPIILQ